MSANSSEEMPPVSDKYKVLRYETINKGDKWWSAAVCYQSEFRQKKQYAFYLWNKSPDGSWRRVQKFIVSERDFEKTVEAMKKIMGASKE